MAHGYLIELSQHPLLRRHEVERAVKLKLILLVGVCRGLHLFKLGLQHLTVLWLVAKNFLEELFNACHLGNVQVVALLLCEVLDRYFSPRELGFLTSDTPLELGDLWVILDLKEGHLILLLLPSENTFKFFLLPDGLLASPGLDIDFVL